MNLELLSIDQLKEMPVKELRAFCKYYGIKNYASFKKAEYIAKLMEVAETLVAPVETPAAEPIHLTALEIKLLNAMRDNEYNDAIEDATWTFTAIDNSGIEAAKARGVISSLIKKDLVECSSERASDSEATIGLTDLGKKLFESADGADCTWGGLKLLKEIEQTPAAAPVVTDNYKKAVADLSEGDKVVKTEVFTGAGWIYTRVTANNYFRGARLVIDGKDIKLKVPSKKNAAEAIKNLLGLDVKLR